MTSNKAVDFNIPIRAAALALTSSFFLGGCMLGLHTGAGHDDSAAHEGGAGAHGPASARIVKELQRDRLRLVADVPALRAGREARLVLSVHETSGDRSTPAKALVDVVVHRQAADGGGRGPEAPRRMLETSEPGVYALQQVFADPGTYRIEFKVTAQSAHGAESSVLELTSTVAGDGGTSRGAAWTLGAIGMGAMMVLMMAAIVF